MKVIYPDNYIHQITASEEDTNYLDDNLVNSYYLKKQWRATSSDATLSFQISGGASAIAIFGTNATDIQIEFKTESTQWEDGVYWGDATEWNSPTTTYNNVFTNLNGTSDGFIWLDYDEVNQLHYLDITLSNSSGETVFGGVAVAGQANQFNSPEYGFNESLEDYSIVRELNNRAYYVRKQEVVRTFSGTFLTKRDAKFWEFLVSIFKEAGGKPLAWQLVETNDPHWVVYARANNELPNGPHDLPKYSRINLQLMEVV